MTNERQKGGSGAEGPSREQGGAGDDQVRDFDPGGDVGRGGHSAFAQEGRTSSERNDERLGERGRDPGRDESSFLEAVDEDRRQDEEPGPGEVRGLRAPPHRDDIGA
jgi:hypothetical protein